MVVTEFIREHMVVIASDGHRIGRVDHVKDGQIELAKMDLETGFKHRMIPVSWVDHVDDHVHLNLTEDQVDVVVDVIDPTGRDHAVLEAGVQVHLGQLDLVALDVVDAANAVPVRGDDVHVFLDVAEHELLLETLMVWLENPWAAGVVPPASIG